MFRLKYTGSVWNMAKNKLYGMLGLAKRAGKVVSGTDAVIDRVRDGSAVLVIVSGDASESTQKRVTDKCKFYGTEYIVYEGVGKAIGKDGCAAIAIVDKNFADAVLNIYNNLTEVAENGSC